MVLAKKPRNLLHKTICNSLDVLRTNSGLRDTLRAPLDKFNIDTIETFLVQDLIVYLRTKCHQNELKGIVDTIKADDMGVLHKFLVHMTQHCQKCMAAPGFEYLGEVMERFMKSERALSFLSKDAREMEQQRLEAARVAERNKIERDKKREALRREGWCRFVTELVKMPKFLNLFEGNPLPNVMPKQEVHMIVMRGLQKLADTMAKHDGHWKGIYGNEKACFSTLMAHCGITVRNDQPVSGTRSRCSKCSKDPSVVAWKEQVEKVKAAIFERERQELARDEGQEISSKQKPQQNDTAIRDQFDKYEERSRRQREEDAKFQIEATGFCPIVRKLSIYPGFLSLLQNRTPETDFVHEAGTIIRNFFADHLRNHTQLAKNHPHEVETYPIMNLSPGKYLSGVMHHLKTPCQTCDPRLPPDFKTTILNTPQDPYLCRPLTLPEKKYLAEARSMHLSEAATNFLKTNPDSDIRTVQTSSFNLILLQLIEDLEKIRIKDTHGPPPPTGLERIWPFLSIRSMFAVSGDFITELEKRGESDEHCRVWAKGMRTYFQKYRGEEAEEGEMEEGEVEGSEWEWEVGLEEGEVEEGEVEEGEVKERVRSRS